MNRPIPKFDVDEIFDKAKQSKFTPFYLIYGWLCLNGYLYDESEWSWGRIYDNRLGYMLGTILLDASSDRKRNARILHILDDVLGWSVTFSGDIDSAENLLVASDDRRKYQKYVNYHEPFKEHDTNESVLEQS